MSERNKAQMRRVIEEVYNRGDLARVDDLAADDMVIHAATGDIVGREAVKQYVAALRTGFPPPTRTSRSRSRLQRATGW